MDCTASKDRAAGYILISLPIFCPQPMFSFLFPFISKIPAVIWPPTDQMEDLAEEGGPDIITHLASWQPTHMSKVNTGVRGHRSTDRHDEWPRVPTRRHAHKPAQEEEGDVWSAPPHHCSTENPFQPLSMSHRCLNTTITLEHRTCARVNRYVCVNALIQSVVCAWALAGWSNLFQNCHKGTQCR